MNIENSQQENATTMTEEEIRFEQVKQAEYTTQLEYVDGRYNTKESAEDNAHVTAWLDKLARRRQLRVERCLTDWYTACHYISILDKNEKGEPTTIECGSEVHMSELKRGYLGGGEWLYNKQEVSEDWVRVKLMIGDNFPDHPMFKRADGSRVDLGFNDDDHYFLFNVVIHKRDLFDNY